MPPSSTPDPPQLPVLAALEPGAVVHGGFRLVERLGAGAQGVTWLATREGTGLQVALKVSSLRAAADWKAVELWEREARTLRHLDHPAIPKYFDGFQARGADGDVLFVLAQAFVAGQSLATLLRDGRRWTEDELRDIARQALGVLVYLHGKQPPVVHRDLKPSNLMWTAAGTLAVIDFGAVQAQLAAGPEGGSTIVGTHGYMPPEQLMGRATPVSDLYALGATLLHLATGRPPAELDVERMKLQFEHITQLSAPFELWLARLVAPVPEDRFASAAAALAALDAPPPVAVSPIAPRRAPGPSAAALRRGKRAFWVMALLMLTVAAVVVAARSNKRSRSRGTATATASAHRDETCKLSVELPVDFSGVTLTPLWCRRSPDDARYRSVRFNARLTNEGTRALGRYIAHVQLLDAAGRMLSGEPHVLFTDFDQVPVQPSESRTIGYSQWKAPAGVAEVRYVFRSPAKYWKPVAAQPVPLTYERLAPLPDGAALELFLRDRSERYGTGVTLVVRNTGSVPLKGIQFEVTFVDAQGQVVDRAVRSMVDSAVDALQVGDQSALRVFSTKSAAQMRYALVKAEPHKP